MIGLDFLFPQRKKAKASRYQEPDVVLNSLNDAILVLDHHYSIQHFNTCWSNMIKRSTKHIIDSLFIDYIHPEDQAKWRDAIQSIPKKLTPTQLTLRILTPDQEIKWFEAQLQQLNPQQIFPITMTLSDVTRKTQQHEIRKAGHRNLAGLVSRMPAILYRGLNNTKWTMEYISDGCFELTGYHPEQLINQTQFSFGDLIHPEDAQSVWEEVQIAIQEQRYFDLSYRLRHVDGHYNRVTEKGQGIYSQSGDVLSIEGIILQVS
ncbi:PAS domain-containing protein [Marinomonas sp. 2405UD66-6]|uniref:PAS domain-containing protein n=1 Tax=Marinomonas sp. 2405UD66-6 TaxID=3391834 RepID=UPI0039C93E26